MGNITYEIGHKVIKGLEVYTVEGVRTITTREGVAVEYLMPFGTWVSSDTLKPFTKQAHTKLLADDAAWQIKWQKRNIAALRLLIRTMLRKISQYEKILKKGKHHG